MSNLGEMTYFLGLEVIQACDIGFEMKILQRYYMENCKSTNTPIAQGEKFSSNEDVERVDKTSYRSLVGCLLFFTASRLDIMFPISLLPRYMHCCNANHYRAAKRVL
ncbi:hypothetical protein EPI10_030477 [Gossypium australe]|uniref:Retrovirus-related Pol polyprotein from transposon TNT 1-94 n=1 Tax=Gossypium australe TaxID=47621 RepID=A0A5B6WYW8_9ROSI|nr:hypothetical protein EPI10_030477 [Gossypium australe]